MDDKTRQRIFELIQKDAQINPSQLDPDKDLRQQVLLDSMQFVSIAARIEAAFDIELPITIMEVSTLNQFMEMVDEELTKIKS